MKTEIVKIEELYNRINDNAKTANNLLITAKNYNRDGFTRLSKSYLMRAEIYIYANSLLILDYNNLLENSKI
jgi:predicted metallo-beta-lactamase superfamily hydrolase